MKLFFIFSIELCFFVITKNLPVKKPNIELEDKIYPGRAFF
jgi:hypothetical protein